MGSKDRPNKILPSERSGLIAPYRLVKVVLATQITLGIANKVNKEGPGIGV